MQPSPLDGIRIASPCTASWDEMQGDDRVRLCGQCQLQVYNIAAMPRNEAEELIRQREGRLCLRILQRADGTLITQDCPMGLRAVRQKAARLLAAAAAMIAMLFVAAYTRVRSPGTAAANKGGIMDMLAQEIARANWRPVGRSTGLRHYTNVMGDACILRDSRRDPIQNVAEPTELDLKSNSRE